MRMTPKKNRKLLLIGWDAADWDIIWPLIRQGKMPALESLIKRGVHGNISTLHPPYSPMLWTSVATGKTPDKHGILGFIEVTPDGKSVRPVTTLSRKSRAIWNIFHNQGMKSNLVSWWPSFPTEPINGFVVSDRFQKTHQDPRVMTPMSTGSVHPWDKHDLFKGLRMFPFEITKAHILPFIPQADKVDQDKHKGLNALAKIVSENTSVHNAATRLLRTTKWDFMAVYHDLIDHFCHSFMKYHPPKHPGVDANNFELFKDAVNGAYIFQDMMLERTLKLIDENTDVMIMSDHGFESGEKRIINMPDVQAAPSLEHRQFGMFVAAGPSFKTNERVYGLSIMDIGPTILHYYGLPIGRDMDGKVNQEFFKYEEEVKFIDSWEQVEGDFGEIDPSVKTDVLSDEQTMEQLVELGYVERLDERIEVAVRNTRIDLKHNLARVHLGKKDFDNAATILNELILEPNARDHAPFHMDMVSICLQRKEFKKALEHLEAVSKAQTKEQYNLELIKSKIYSAMGRPKDALAILEDQLDRKFVSSSIYFQIGQINFELGSFQEAMKYFELAIEKDSQKPNYHAAMAEVLLQLDEVEEAAEYALTSVELVKYFPQGHLLLGQALERMGDLENAKIAFEMANRLRPRSFPKAEQALENIQEKLNLELALNDKASFKYRENQIVIVSGLPRSGTSMMMQILEKAGIEILQDDKREADESNPKGYYEYEPVKSLFKDNTWLNLAQNKAVKVVAPLLKYLSKSYRYKVVFMNRDIDQVIRSQQKMLGKNEKDYPVHLHNQFQKLLKSVEGWQKMEPGVEILYVNHSKMMNNSKQELERIANFLGLDLDIKAMASVIDTKLHRNR